MKVFTKHLTDLLHDIESDKAFNGKSGGGGELGQLPEWVEENTIVKVKAKVDFKGEKMGDLAFKKGDQMAIVYKAGDWWVGWNGEMLGLVPSNFVN